MDIAWIDGQPTSREKAVAAAADLLRASRLPIFDGLRADLAAIRAAIGLARAAGGVIDHHSSAAIYPTISAIRDSGAFLAAPAEMRRRADRILLVGPDPFAHAPDLPDFLLAGEPDLGTRTRGHQRQVVWLGAPEGATLPGKASVRLVRCEKADLTDALSMIRAALADRRFGQGPLQADETRELAGWLKGAGFGCAIFSASDLDALGAEMLLGLVGDLNAGTRFSTLPVFPGDEVYGAALAATWATGFPLRVSLGRGAPEHDPTLFEAGRLAASGEADLLIDVSALGEGESAPPERTGSLPVIAVASGMSAPPRSAKVAFSVAAAGRDHDGVFFNARFGSFAPVSAGARAGALPTAAEILNALAAELAPEARDAAA
ncbi:hypothetical protein [Aurantimonas sp. VKM B-3413]|uniref:hypothetical protein n=1 Tax=Aurantimonas sp. VKM B-3413 TaxID=2779401 RepID=UPI001E64E946|nr:hypothetical protein [Aurantimonas sp. VKM B-3413]MCB8838221.1 hypothetical protein [Aurantimonas sp. VKM B-3413]